MLKRWHYTAENPNALVLSPAQQPETRPYTVADLVAAYLDYLQKHSQGSTYRDAASALRSRILPKFAHVELYNLTPEALEQAHAADPHPVAANRAMAYLRAAWNRGERLRWAPPGSNPLRFLGDFTAPEAPRATILSDEEQSLVLAEIARQRAAWTEAWASERSFVGDPRRSPAWAAVLLIMLTGARHREILLLKWREVKDGALHLEKSKTGAKVLFLSKPAQELLTDIRSRQLDPPDPDSRVFEGVDLRRAWERIRKVCGCEHVTLHDLRRGYATRLLSTGNVELVDVARCLGHKSMRMAASVYTPLQKKRQQAIAEIGAQAILGATTEVQEG